MTLAKIAFALVAFTAAQALAQQQPAPSPEIQALQARIMQEVSGSLQCSAIAIELREANAKLKAEINALKKAATDQ